MEEDADTVTLKHLEQRALSVGQCKNIWQKIKERVLKQVVNKKHSSGKPQRAKKSK